MIFYSRAFEDDPNYFPNWRSLQVREYLKHYDQAQNANPPENFILPDEEDDEYVLDYFSLLTLGDCNSNSIKYAHSCNETNQSRGFGTVMQAMLMGGCNYQKIASEMNTSIQNIEAYFKLFFDMERYLECDPLVSFVIVPFQKTEDTFSSSRQSSLWLGISYAFGWEKAKYLLNRRVDVDANTVKVFRDALENCINLQAAEFAMAIRSGGVARPADFDRHIALTNATAMTQAMSNDSMSNNASSFRNALFGLITQAGSELPDSHPVRQMIREKEADVIEIGEKVKLPKKKFGFLPPRPL